MPTISKTFEFFNPWVTRNDHTSQVSLTMPQMVNGQRPILPLEIYSEKTQGSGYYRLGSRTHSVTYSIAGAFIGTCIIQTSTNPNPTNGDWTDHPESFIRFNGNETTGGAGVSGGFSGSISRPVKTEIKHFTGEFSWIRVKVTIQQGTLQSVRLNF